MTLSMNLRNPDYVKRYSKAHQIFMRLIGRLQYTHPVTEDEKDYLFGILSGFPECCVTFYVDEWLPYAQEHGTRALWQHWPDQRKANVGFIPCPAHLEQILAAQVRPRPVAVDTQ